MLALLTLNEAALYLMHWHKKIDKPLVPDSLKTVLDGELKGVFWLYLAFVRNAIDAGVLPVQRKPINRATEKKRFEAFGVPEELRDLLPKQFECWVTYSDLLVFAERPDRVTDDESFAHGRDAVARVAWILLRKHAPTLEVTGLFDFLAQLSSDVHEAGPDPKLGDTTLKSCIREILSVGGPIEPKS